VLRGGASGKASRVSDTYDKASSAPAESADEPNTPLQRVIRLMHKRLSATVVNALTSNLRLLAKCKHNCFGTLSSGSDVFAVVIRDLAAFWSAEYGITIEIKQAFACESHKVKASFITTNIDADSADACVFIDNAKMSGCKAYCSRHDNMCAVPHVRTGGAGFSCQSRSSANNKRTSHVGCVQRGTGKTGQSWVHVREYLEAHRPDSFLLENVPSLGQATSDSVESSDAAFIMKELGRLGYGTVLQIILQARDYGARTSRKRLWWLAVLAGKPELVDLITAIIEQTKIKLAERDPIEEFLLGDGSRELDDAASGDEMVGSKFDSMAYKGEHMELFDAAQLEWPAPRSGQTALPQCNHLDQRAYEVAYFAHHVWPYKPGESGAMQYEFMDPYVGFCCASVFASLSASPLPTPFLVPNSCLGL
jgi:site-specific DNA-cytosine methylase